MPETLAARRVPQANPVCVQRAHNAGRRKRGGRAQEKRAPPDTRGNRPRGRAGVDGPVGSGHVRDGAAWPGCERAGLSRRRVLCLRQSYARLPGSFPASHHRCTEASAWPPLPTTLMRPAGVSSAAPPAPLSRPSLYTRPPLAWRPWMALHAASLAPVCLLASRSVCRSARFAPERPAHARLPRL